MTKMSVCLPSYHTDLLLCVHVELLSQGSDFFVFLVRVFLDNGFDLHCLFPSPALTLKVFRVLLQLGEQENRKEQ